MQPDRAPVAFGRTLVVVQAGEHEAVRAGVRPEALRVLQEPGTERPVLRHQPHPAARPAAHLGSFRKPRVQFVRRAPGLAEESVHLGADPPDPAVLRIRQRVATPPAMALVLMHGVIVPGQAVRDKALSSQAP